MGLLSLSFDVVRYLIAHGQIELKVINAWPTYPQLIIKGELVGGLDVVKDTVESGEFQELVA